MRHLIDTRYRTIEILGSGGMADVYLAHDAILDREVALKVIGRGYANDHEVVERFRSEARSVAALSHPNIVSVYDWGEAEDGTYYIVMEYLSGGTLKDRILRERRLPPRTAAEVATQVAEALSEAHRNGVVHRDVKPQNILLTESGDVKVVDFGIARAASSAALTRTGVVLGSVHYMSPEQAIGAPVDPRSDLYSLGIVLYEMLTGELPYDGENVISVAMKHVEGRLRPPRRLNPSIPAGMNAVTVRLLAKDPEERYPDADSLLDDLDRARRGSTPSAATIPTVVRSAAKTLGDGGSTTSWEGGTAALSPPATRRDNKWRPWIFPVVIAATLVAVLALMGAMGSYLWQDVREVSDVSVAEASSLIEVPDVKGQGIEEASQMLRDAGLAVSREPDMVQSNEAEGTVLGSDPPAGSEVEAGTSVTLTVSRGAPQKATTRLDAPPGSGTAATPKLTTNVPNTQQPGPNPVPSPIFTPPMSAPEQPDPEQIAEEYREQQVPEDDQPEVQEAVLDDQREIQEDAPEKEESDIQKRVRDALDDIQDKVGPRAGKPGEDRIGAD